MQFRLWRLAARSLIHPRLLVLLPRAAWRFRARDWWRRPPFLPLPPRDYIRWRLHTAFGNEQAEPDLHQLQAYLAWTAQMQQNGRAESRRRHNA